MKPLPIEVVGGAYIEECSFPRRQIFRGSGGRAAAFLGSVGVETTLNTQLGYQSGPEFRDLAKRLGYSIKCIQDRPEIIFRYDYPLAAPKIYTTPSETAQPKEAITCEHSLIFGMIEDRPPVKAQKAVYDAQDGCKAKHFSDNSSHAKELALVLSYSEGLALSGKNSPVEMADFLMGKDNSSVVIVKCGPQGAYITTKDGQSQWVPPFKTDRVYKIGSGDIFSAAFAYAWLAVGAEPYTAAWFASKCCSLYVGTGIDRQSPDIIEKTLSEAETNARTNTGSSPLEFGDGYIYLAGPFFNTAQQWLITDIRRAILDMGFKVFSPIHDVGIGTAENVATKDLEGLEGAQVVLAILDGADPGTIFEVGFAKAKGIKVFAVAESVQGESLTMISGTGCYVFDDLTSGIYAACWELMKNA